MSMNLRRLELTLTTKCNSQCVHCQAEASPLGNEVMDVKDARDYLAEAASVSNLGSFMVFGGEPMLYSERAIAIFEKANQLKIPEIEMITNGIWGNDVRKAEKLAKKLKAAGLNTLAISVDSFHSQHIPLECPRNAALASVKAGIKNVQWNVTVVESVDAVNEYDRKTKQILETLRPVGIEADMHNIIPVGRAAMNLRKYLEPPQLDGPCSVEPFMNESLKDPKSICIEPSGAVSVCWSLSIGNAKKTLLSKIIGEYDWQKDIIIRTLMEEGPLGLLKLPEAQGLRIQERGLC